MARIVVVEDDRDVVDMLHYLLQQDGHTVLEAIDGQEGLALIQENRPDLVILDVMLPSLDGVALNTKLLEKEETRNIPVIVLTAKIHQQPVFESSPNVRNVIEKPFDPTAFRTLVKQLTAS